MADPWLGFLLTLGVALVTFSSTAQAQNVEVTPGVAVTRKVYPYR